MLGQNIKSLSLNKMKNTFKYFSKAIVEQTNLKESSSILNSYLEEGIHIKFYGNEYNRKYKQTDTFNDIM
jgi:hypothetical protein